MRIERWLAWTIPQVTCNLAHADRPRKTCTDRNASIERGATEDQAVAAVLLPQYRNMVGYDQQRPVLVRRMYQGLKGTRP